MRAGNIVHHDASHDTVLIRIWYWDVMSSYNILEDLVREIRVLELFPKSYFITKTKELGFESFGVDFLALSVIPRVKDTYKPRARTGRGAWVTISLWGERGDGK
jgi:hypothetical protein